MPTVREVCSDALRKLDVVPLGGAADGDEIAEALRAYNNMLHGWGILGVDTSHVTQGLNDTFPLEDKFIEGTVYILASRLSPNFQIPPQFDVDGWWRAIQAEYTTVNEVTFDAGLKNLPSQRFRRYF